MLKKGDLCYVRLVNGTIVKAIYLEKPGAKNCHRVKVAGSQDIDYFFASKNKPRYSRDCRFVCTTGLNESQMQSLGLKVKER